MLKVFACVLFNVSNLFAQGNCFEVELNNYYKYSGNIFKAEYRPWFEISESKERYTPSEDDIIKAENIFLNTYNEKDDKQLVNFKEGKSYKRKYYKWRRNYLGYLDGDGNKVIIIHLINFTHRKKASAKYEEWGKEIIIGYGEWFEKNQLITYINITTKIVLR